ncbi:PREDICTED: uncharacterized protein LOC108561456 [Nicrophorus vespilloides]|uniref:Uncharacterized protein LOC108561456 n=1 Tax=Nicrophorus vespilloides TaxID=110193 RepID=A0ABM1MJY5_NICVS|nr:PREDICTED: uncharacterized protein LOC108561456 [Nicrophorus vespilloides]
MLTRRDKILVRPWEDRKYENHLRKIQSALPVIDNRTPPTREHVSTKLKKKQKEVERIAKIEVENLNLLRKMNFIMRTNRVDNYWTKPLPNFLNRVTIYETPKKFKLEEDFADLQLKREPSTDHLRKSKCSACSPKKYQKYTICEGRVPWEPQRGQVGRGRSKSVPSRENTLPMISEKPKKKKPKSTESIKKMRSFEDCITNNPQKLVLTSGSLKLSLNFPSDTQIKLHSGPSEKVLIGGAICNLFQLFGLLLISTAILSEYQEKTDKHVDYFAPVKYTYSYGVEDFKTGDYKMHKEERNGDVVKGEYRIADPDGSIRTVTYTADKEHGFQAIVKQSVPFADSHTMNTTHNTEDFHEQNEKSFSQYEPHSYGSVESDNNDFNEQSINEVKELSKKQNYNFQIDGTEITQNHEDAFHVGQHNYEASAAEELYYAPPLIKIPKVEINGKLYKNNMNAEQNFATQSYYIPVDYEGYPNQYYVKNAKQDFQELIYQPQHFNIKNEDIFKQVDNNKQGLSYQTVSTKSDETLKSTQDLVKSQSSIGFQSKSYTKQQQGNQKQAVSYQSVMNGKQSPVGKHDKYYQGAKNNQEYTTNVQKQAKNHMVKNPMQSKKQFKYPEYVNKQYKMLSYYIQPSNLKMYSMPNYESYVFDDGSKSIHEIQGYPTLQLEEKDRL